MRVAVGALARNGLEERVGPDLPGAINAALVYYVGKLQSGRGPAKFPKFLARRGNNGGTDFGTSSEGEPINPEAEVEVHVDERIEAALVREAARQGVSAPDLAGHAVLIYLAELDLIGDPTPAPERRVPA